MPGVLPLRDDDEAGDLSLSPGAGWATVSGGGPGGVSQRGDSVSDIKERLAKLQREADWSLAMPLDPVADIARDALARIQELETAQAKPGQLCIEITRRVLLEESARLERVLRYDFGVKIDG